MTGRTRREAVIEHRRALQRLVATVTDAVIIVRPSQWTPWGEADERVWFALNNAEPTRVAGPAPLTVSISQQIHPRRDLAGGGNRWVADSAGYFYELAVDGEEIVAYHWHPGSPGDVGFAHLHVGPAATRFDSRVRAGDLHKVHFPTGDAPLADFLRLSITEFGVEPRRADRESILQE